MRKNIQRKNENLSYKFDDILSVSSEPEDLFSLLYIICKGEDYQIYKAIHNETKAIYAIKIVDYSKNNNRGNNIIINNNYSSIQQEASHMKLLIDCQYIVKYYGSYFSRKSNTLWLILEYCSSGSVIDLMCSMDRTFNEYEISTIITMVLKGLDYIHKKNLIHRDIKGANILLNEDGIAKIADFGSCVQLIDEENKNNKDSSMIKSNSKYNYKDDIWQLGITCLEMIEGEYIKRETKQLFEGEKIAKKNSMIEKLLNKNKYSEEFKDFVKKCLQLKQNKRLNELELLEHDFIKKFNKGNDYIKDLVKNNEKKIEKNKKKAIQKQNENIIEDNIYQDEKILIYSEIPQFKNKKFKRERKHQKFDKNNFNVDDNLSNTNEYEHGKMKKAQFYKKLLNINEIKNKNVKYISILILFFLYLLTFNYYKVSILKNELQNNDYPPELINEITKVYETFDKVNINEIDNKINKNEIKNAEIKSTINVGFTLDANYVPETMMTVASIMASQFKTTKIRFHFGVTNNFTAEKMLKMYSLKSRLNNLTEFNFYYLKESVVKMKDFHPKGEACPGKFELPMYVPDDIERLFIFDAGDLLVLRDLSDVYNYNMENYWVLGTLETLVADFIKTKYNQTKYVNIGSILLNVKKLKENNFWSTYTKNRNIELTGAPDQTLFNVLIPDDKKNYLPFKFGGYSLFTTDQNYDSLKYEPYGLKKFFTTPLVSSLPDNPGSESGIIFNLYNARFIHQFSGKWDKGDGLSIYRHLAKYFIMLAGVTDELCLKKPGYCV